MIIAPAGFEWLPVLFNPSTIPATLPPPATSRARTVAAPDAILPGSLEGRNETGAGRVLQSEPNIGGRTQLESTWIVGKLLAENAPSDDSVAVVAGKVVRDRPFHAALVAYRQPGKAPVANSFRLSA